MAYTQPFPYVNGNTLSSVEIISNEESMKNFVNQEIAKADIAVLSLDKTDIAKGSYNAIERSYSFVTGDIVGQHALKNISNREYQTSTAKNNVQTTGIQWQDICNSGVRVHAKQTCIAIINVMVNYKVNDNEVLPPQGQGNGLWFNTLILSVRNIADNSRTLYENSTDTYVFEGSGGVLDTKDPGAGAEQASGRVCHVTYRISLQAGYYGITMTVNPHNEEGWTEAKNMTVELFYI